MIQAGPDEKLYPVNKLVTLVGMLKTEGIAAARALESVGLSENDLTSPATRVSLNQVLQAYRNAIHLSTDLHFAYHAGQHFHIPTFGMFGFAILSSTDFRQTMRFVLAYRQLVAPTTVLSFKEIDGRAVWTIDPISHPDVDAAMYRFLVELQFGIQTTMHRDVMGTSFAPREISVTYGPNNNPPTDAEVFGCQVAFRQAANEYAFDAKWLDNTPEHGNPVTYSLLVGLCDQLLAELKVRAGFTGKVREILLPNLMRTTGVDAVASRLNMTGRTLRRKLQDEKTSFQAILDELRMEVAIKYLRETHLSIDDIAYAVGFSEATNFRHAFRRWTKAAPNDFREPAGSSVNY